MVLDWIERGGVRDRGVAVVALCLLGCPSDDASSDSGAADDSGGTATSQGSDADADSGTPGTSTADDTTDGPDPDSTTTDADPGWSMAYEVGDDVGTFLSVWGPAADDLFAVGGQVDPDRTLTRGAMAHFDGSTWSPVALPDGTASLNWIYGVGERRVVVGDFGTVLWRDGDEGEWTEGSCATVLPLWGTWGAATDDIWAVGGDGFNKDPVLCHFDGAAWSAVELPEPSVETHALFKVWGSGPDNVFAVGDGGWIVHYDGTVWSEQASGTESDLISLWGSGPDDIVAVGGRSQGTLSRWDGTGWTATTLDGVAGLNGVWMDAAGDAVVAGTFGTLGRVAASTMDFVEDDAGTILALHAVFGVTDSIADGPLVAVGGSLDMPPPYIGVILAWPGS